MEELLKKFEAAKEKQKAADKDVEDTKKELLMVHNKTVPWPTTYPDLRIAEAGGLFASQMLRLSCCNEYMSVAVLGRNGYLPWQARSLALYHLTGDSSWLNV